jgi:uncharacterized damage-inducible protein DinB
MKPFFRELFEYSHHFNIKLAKAILENRDKVSERSVKLFSHVLNAHRIWNNRIDPGKVNMFGVWAIHTPDVFEGIEQENYDHTLSILDRFDLGPVIEYKTTRGDLFRNSIRDILFHVVNHSTHHRAQIASDFRQSGIEPLVTDYVFYKR